MKLKNYSNYEIFPEEGKVFSYTKNKFIGSIARKGYLSTELIDDMGNVHIWRIHRLIWTAVNGEIPDGMHINHIDEDKTNNSIFNLNLMSPTDNNNWGTRNKRSSITKSKPILGLKNNEIKHYFYGQSEAHRNGFNQAKISLCCLNKRKSHKGYEWVFVDDYLADWWDREYMS